MTEDTKAQDEQLTPKKKRALLEYMGIMFAVAFLLVAVSLLVKMQSMQEDFDAANTGASVGIEALERKNEELTRSARATELLALAQNALHGGDTVGFHAYMAELEGNASALSEPSQEIYSELLDEMK